MHAYLGGPGKRGSPGIGAEGASGVSPAATGSEPVTLFEDTGVTYAPPASTTDLASIWRLETRRQGEALSDSIAFLVVGLVAVRLGLSAEGSVRAGLLGAGAGLALLAVWSLRRVSLGNRARGVLRWAIHPAVAEGRPLTDEELAKARRALQDPRLTTAARFDILSGAYLDAARRIVVDGFVTPDELRLLNQFEKELGVDAEFARWARADAFRGVFLSAVADHELTPEKEAELEHVREALHVPPDDVAFQLDILARHSEVRRIRDGELPVVEPTVPLPRSETCHSEWPGRLLKEKNLRTFQRDGVRYRVRGFTINYEGKFLITDRRVLLVHAGTTSVPMNRTLDVEADTDHNVLRIMKDGASTPVVLTTPDALRAAAIIAAVRGI